MAVINVHFITYRRREVIKWVLINSLTPTVAIWVQLESILCQTRLSLHL